MKSIYTCPYCGAKSFNPWKKAFAGGLRTKGKVCLECGQHCVNGVASMIFSAVVYMVGAVAAAFVLCRLFDAFFGPLVKPIRNDVLN